MDKIEIQIKNVLETIPKEANALGGWPDAYWTKEIKVRLGKIGKDNGYKTCYAYKGDKIKHDYGEWLYDMTWIDFVEGNLISVPLVMECEWQTNDDGIDSDFQKLLLARADHRVMIFQKKSIDDIINKMADFRNQIYKFKGTKPRDRYLFIGYVIQGKIFEFRSFQTGT